MKVLYVAYRKWAFDILGRLLFEADRLGNFSFSNRHHLIGLATSEKKYEGWKEHKHITDLDILFPIYKLNDEKNDLYELARILDPSLILIYGWSWKVPKRVTDEYQCVCLHPSPLPKYRGGSPIQNQIINGEKTGAVTLFQMDDGIDTGPIFFQGEIDLKGNLNDVLKRIVDTGSYLTEMLLQKFGQNGVAWSQSQNEKEATYYERRKPKDSRITIDEIRDKPAEYLYNKVRALQDPYPNAYLECADGKKLYITRAKLEDEAGN